MRYGRLHMALWNHFHFALLRRKQRRALVETQSQEDMQAWQDRLDAMDKYNIKLQGEDQNVVV